VVRMRTPSFMCPRFISSAFWLHRAGGAIGFEPAIAAIDNRNSNPNCTVERQAGNSFRDLEMIFQTQRAAAREARHGDTLNVIRSTVCSRIERIFKSYVTRSLGTTE
jgi:hypothetical protein